MTGKSGVSRRDLFQIIGSVPALAAATAGAGAAQTHAAPQGGYQRKVFDEHDWHTVRVLCDLIVPADDRSGSATQAGVPEFIDDWLDFRRQEDGNDDLAAQILGGVAWLDLESSRLFGKTFADTAADGQKQILDRIAWPERAKSEDKRWAAFFSKFRDLTLNGFYSSKIGIADLPYLGNTAVEEWKGCDPAVWARLEERMKNGYQALGGEVKPWA
jgi:gluconate 2-dehydrogenase gamma chain